MATAIAEAETRQRLLRTVKKEVKQIMEEAVTRKFVHEDSSHIVSFCGAVEACILHGLKRRAAGFLRSNKVAALFTKVAKCFPPAEELCKKAQELEQIIDSKRSQTLPHQDSTRKLPKFPNFFPQGFKHLWIRTALIEKVLDKIVLYLVENSSKFYEKEAIMMDPVDGHILASLLVGPCALEYTKMKTADHFWTDPSADELLQRHRIHSGHCRQDSPTKRPALCIQKRHSSSSIDERPSPSPSARDYVESLHQNSRATLLFGKNNVLVQPRDDMEAIPGYLSLHQMADVMTLKWTPNQLMNRSIGDLEYERSVYWDYAMTIPLEEIVYLHCHQQVDSGGTVVLVSQDGIQRPPLRFPRGGHLLQFLSCLENGLLPHGQLDPPLWSQRGKGKVFPKLRKRGTQGSYDSVSDKEEDEATDYVFRILFPNSQSEFAAAELMEQGPPMWQPTPRRSSCSSCSQSSFSEGAPPNGCNHERAPLKLLCDNMKYQIISRAFYGWLAYCRHLSTVRTHLSALVNHTIVAPDAPCDAYSGLTSDVWQSFLQDCSSCEETELLRLVYFGGVEPSLRKEVWPFLLGHYQFGMSVAQRQEVDEQVRLCYEQTMSEWQGCEAIVKQREREQHAVALAKCSSGASIDSSSQKLLHRDSTLSNESSQSCSSDRQARLQSDSSSSTQVFESVEEAEQIETEPKGDEPKQAPKVPNGALQNGTSSPDSGHPSSRNFSTASGLSDSLSTEDSGIHEPSPRGVSLAQQAAAPIQVQQVPGQSPQVQQVQQVPPQSPQVQQVQQVPGQSPQVQQVPGQSPQVQQVPGQSPQVQQPPSAPPRSSAFGADPDAPEGTGGEEEQEAQEPQIATEVEEVTQEEEEEEEADMSKTMLYEKVAEVEKELEAEVEKDGGGKGEDAEKDEESQVKDIVMETEVLVTEERKIECAKEEAGEPEEEIEELGKPTETKRENEKEETVEAETEREREEEKDMEAGGDRETEKEKNMKEEPDRETKKETQTEADTGAAVIVSDTGEQTDTAEASAAADRGGAQVGGIVAAETKEDASSEAEPNTQAEKDDMPETRKSTDTKEGVTSDTEPAWETQEDVTSPEEKPAVITQDETSDVRREMIAETEETCAPIKTQAEPIQTEPMDTKATDIIAHTPLKTEAAVVVESVTKTEIEKDIDVKEDTATEEDEGVKTAKADRSLVTEQNGSSESEETVELCEAEQAAPERDEEAAEIRDDTERATSVTHDSGTSVTHDKADIRGDMATSCDTNLDGEVTATKSDVTSDDTQELDRERKAMISDVVAGESAESDTELSATEHVDTNIKVDEAEAKDSGIAESTPPSTPAPESRVPASFAQATRVLEVVMIHQPPARPPAPDSDESPTAIEMEDIPTAQASWQAKPSPDTGSGDQAEGGITPVPPLEMRREEGAKLSPGATGSTLTEEPEMGSLYPQFGSLAGAAEKAESTSPAASIGATYSQELLDMYTLNLHRIDKDVQRCDRNYWYFTPANLEKLRNIMCSYIWQHLDTGYVQGMCDLLAPLLVILDDEALAFSCFSELMKRMNQNFPHGGAMDTHFANMRSLIQILDSELFELMHQNGDYTHFYFCYRWFLLDFKRELVYDDVFSVWETIWAAKYVSSSHFVLFIALALVEIYRDIILENNMDFTDIIKFFNEMAEHHSIKQILTLARDLVCQVQTLIENK
ncbi:hypothetical protein ACEWY4_011636 [Coilia grayii]|uniref:Small G protein signaling modulator 1 n=1 Tax=Coilia grayii TaxID=363190 RepID=A0ABD1JYB5_9TELE